MNFLKIPTKIHYGLFLLTEMLRLKNNEVISLSDISKKYGISKGYLEEIARHLVKANIINGKRGFAGGYVLSKNFKKITLFNIFKAFTPLNIIDCGSKKNSCLLDFNCSCGPKKVFLKMQDDFLRVLKNIKLTNIK